MLLTIPRAKLSRISPPLLQRHAGTYLASQSQAWYTSKSRDVRHSHHKLSIEQSDAVDRALRIRQAQAGAQEPFFYAERSLRRQWTNIIQSLNVSFRKAAANPQSILWQKELWTDYIFTKRKLPSLLLTFSDEAWQVLWKIQSNSTPANPDPRERQLILLEDMKSIGRSLSLPFQLAQIESLFAKGEVKQALKQWEEVYSPKGNSNGNWNTAGSHPEYMDLGVRLYLEAGHLERAAEVAAELYEIYPNWHSQSVVAMAKAQIRTSNSADDALIAYRRLECASGHRLSRQDYDEFMLAFLKAQSPLGSYAVFADMVKYKYLASDDSQLTAGATLKRLRTIMSFCKTEEHINEVGLRALSTLPSTYMDWLFAQWLGVIVFNGYHDSTAKLIELMYERGTKPRARHFNLMVASLFKTRDPRAIVQAENVAWKMVDERLNDAKAASDTGLVSVNVPSTKWQRVPFFLKRYIPKATSGTFSQLIDFYTKARRWEALREVQSIMQFVDEKNRNRHFLNALLYAEAAGGNDSRLWDLYHAELLKGMEGSYRSTSDARTFWTLWLALRRCSYSEPDARPTHCPHPRDLMADMVSWFNRSESPLSRQSHLHFLQTKGDLSNTISTCFYMYKDLPGQLVAMHVLAQIFELHTTPKAVHAIHRSLSLINLPTATEAQRREVHASGAFNKRIERLLRVQEALGQQRAKSALAAGEDIAALQNDRLFKLNLLSELIRTLMLREYGPEEVERLIDEAKRDIGVPNIETGDVNAFDLV